MKLRNRTTASALRQLLKDIQALCREIGLKEHEFQALLVDTFGEEDVLSLHIKEIYDVRRHLVFMALGIAPGARRLFPNVLCQDEAGGISLCFEDAATC